MVWTVVVVEVTVVGGEAVIRIVVVVLDRRVVLASIGETARSMELAIVHLRGETRAERIPADSNPKDTHF
jgi:hypothetical protein